MSVTAVGDAPLSYEWWGEFGPLVPAQTNATLTFTAVELTDGGSYRVVVRNAVGNVISTAATLTVNPPAGTAGENFLWARKAGGAGADPGANIAADSAGNVYLVGSFTGSATIGGATLNGSGGSDMFLAKFNRAGSLLWARKARGLGDDFGVGVAVDNFGNVHVTGSFDGSADFNGTILTSSGSSDLFVACYDRNGNLLWTRSAGGPGTDRASRIAADAAGNSYVIGNFAGTATFGTLSLSSSGGSDDIFLAKFSSSGLPLWAKRFGGAGADSGTSLALGGSGTVFIAGRFRGPADFGSVTLSDGGATEVFVAKCDSAGTVLWARKAGGVDTDAGVSVVVGDDGNSYMSGSFSGVATFSGTALTNREMGDRFVAIYDANGTLTLASRAGGLSGQDVGLGIKAADGGSVSALANGGVDYSAGAGGSVDLVVGRFSGPNSLLWGKQAGADYAGFSLGHSVDDAGNYYLVGFFEDPMAGTNAPGHSLAQVRLAQSSPPLPPMIVLQPQSRVVAPGSSASFSVTANATTALSYQWRFNGAVLSDANSATYTISSAQQINEGTYQVVVFNADGSATSAEVTLSVQNPIDTTAPTVAFSSPAANAKFANPSVTIQGTSADNIGVARVDYRLNGGTFQPATGTTNWSVTLTLAIGTNMVQIKSIDAAGNESAVASRSFIYAPVSPLSLTISGQGTVSPNLNGQLLEIGASYSITATPSAGYAFSGWSGDVTSPDATLTFTMQSNLTLRATFIDATAPSIAFMSPAAGTKFTNATITIQGTASDNVAIARVDYQLNSAPFQTASGTTNWSAGLTLGPGTNTVRVKSIDSAGNESALVSRGFVYSPVSPIAITVNGFGAVTPNLNGQFLELGASYTVTAVPGTNTIFTGWSGALNSANAVLNFTMQAGLSLQANFATNPPPDTTAPAVTFTAPAADTRFTNAVIPIQGTASDNANVARVEYQIGPGPAQTATGTTNWSATVTLAPGTNTVSVRAFDTSGNASPLVTRRFVYALVSPLTITINGNGSVTPNLNGQLLEIGANYTMTAMPATGYSFAGWSDGLTNSNAVLNFTMQPNLSLRANFTDAVAPTVAISSPAANAKFNNAAVTIQGTASDNVGVARVEYQIGSGLFQTASGTTNWSAALTLAPGTNVVRVRSIDLAGNASALATRNFVYAPLSPLVLVVNGSGTVAPNLNGQLLEIGASYTVVATPAAGFAFNRWSGDATSTNATLTFTMQANMIVQANFSDSTAPTVAFVSPTGNARFTNAAITIQGTASDNVAVARVDYQLNSGAFQTATGTTNWAASITLAPGTNTVRVKSIDNLGNESALVTRSFVYAPVSALIVTVRGSGTVSPNLNGQLLEIGASYTMTAAGAAGFAFAGWSGGVTSPDATLTFTMQTGLTLTATFADTTPPVVAILSPAANARLTNASVVVQGTASDNVRIARVDCQLNGGPFVSAAGTNNWSAPLTLAPGTNAVRVKSIDGAGNESALVTRSFVYVPVGPLSLTINGNGSVVPNLNGQWLEIGASYTLTAVPMAGFTFAGWSGGASGGNATLTFVMQPGLALAANFSDGSAPSVAFTSPEDENARVDSAALTIQGTASDDVAVARVEYQINSGAFQIATGTTTWSASITLASGTNVVRVRSVDNLGNSSAVVTRNIIYAPANALFVTVSGNGSVVPDLNGQPLEIGTIYTVTAVPGPGFAFGNWTGGVVGENPVLTFTMHANLVIQANFYDAGAPRVTITSPAANARFTDTVLMMVGTAIDSGGVDRVEYQLGAGSYQLATGTTNWTASIVLAPGTNIVRVRAIDIAGIASPIVTRSFVYAPASQLTVTVDGSGSVTPDLNGQLLEIGASYTISAMPAVGNVFSGWSGGASGSNRVLTFTMQPGLTLAANFATAAPTNSLVVTNYLKPAKGLYTGLFYEDTGVQHHSSGFFTLTSTELGRYTASMRTAGRVLALSGRFTADGKATNLVRRPGTNALTVELQLHLGSDLGTLTGQISDGGWTANLAAERTSFNATTNPAPFAGKCTLIIPGNSDSSISPGGDGYGTVAVSPSGYANFSGTLGDGTPTVSQRVPLTKNGVWPLYASLYSGRGSLLSWMHFVDRPSDDLNGLLSWIKPALPTTKFYSGGFTNEIFVLGSIYTPPATRTNRVLNFSSSFVEFSGANLADPFTEDVLLSTTNKVIDMGNNRLKMNVTLSSGLFSGSVINPNDGKTISYKGAVLQKLNLGFGLHFGTNRTGRVIFSQ